VGDVHGNKTIMIAVIVSLVVLICCCLMVCFAFVLYDRRNRRKEYDGGDERRNALRGRLSLRAPPAKVVQSVAPAGLEPYNAVSRPYSMRSLESQERRQDYDTPGGMVSVPIAQGKEPAAPLGVRAHGGHYESNFAELAPATSVVAPSSSATYAHADDEELKPEYV